MATLIADVAKELRFPTDFLLNLVQTASYHYKSYNIPKRKGGTRRIDHPAKELKAVQRWLVWKHISKWSVHEAATAYRPGGSILQNAKVHAAHHFLLRMDLEDFFPSISSSDVESFVGTVPEASSWSKVDIEHFVKLVCKYDALTIGAPSSPALSNAICHELDVKLSAIAAQQASTYTRYADDLFFSTSVPNRLRLVEAEVPRVLSSLGVPTQLRINASKTSHTSKRHRRLVTGIILGSDDHPHVPRAAKRYIRSMIHNWARLTDEQKKSLAGWIAYVRGFEPQFVNQLIKKFGLPAVEAASRQT